MPKCSVTYLKHPKTGELSWQCPVRMGNKAIQPISAKRCWRHNCKGVKPPSPNLFCQVEECTNFRKLHKDSKYCSSKCASKERTRRWRERKRNNALPVSPSVPLSEGS